MANPTVITQANTIITIIRTLNFPPSSSSSFLIKCILNERTSKSLYGINIISCYLKSFLT